jgi:hypothetical protein
MTGKPDKRLGAAVAEFESLVNELKGDCDKCPQDFRERLLIFDSQIEALRQEREALAKERRELRAEREKLAALYQINMRVLNIVNAPGKAGEQRWQRNVGGNQHSSQSLTLKAYAKNSR